MNQPALAAARRIGPVEIDHGETNCVTRNAVEFLTNPKVIARLGRVYTAKSKRRASLAS